VTFPIVVEVSGLSSFCVVAQPEISQPLLITHTTGIPETAEDFGGALNKDLASSEAEATAERGCIIESEWLGGHHAQPFTSAAGCTIAVGVALLTGDVNQYYVEFLVRTAGVWSVAAFSNSYVGGGSFNLTAGYVYGPTSTHYAFRMTPMNVTDNFGLVLPGQATANYSVAVNAGTGTCAATPLENVFDVYMPEWTKILEVADKISIPYMDCLVTYQGSTLDNQGAIAVCGASEPVPMVNGNYYSAVASRPFDCYEGRLASAGESEGGGHWHLLHDNIAAYSMAASEDLITGPRGYFAVKGMDPNQTVRVMCHITLNYYTIDPAFQMRFQPPWGDTDLLLYTLRTQVPLVSSNDSHLNKLLNLAKRKAKQAGSWALQNPEQAALMAMAAAEFVGPMLI